MRGEIIVADNGSTKGSPAIAEKLGARVVPVREKGYGSALRLQFKSGVQHQHVRVAGEQRPGAGNACGTETDDTVHNFSLPKRQ